MDKDDAVALKDVLDKNCTVIGCTIENIVAIVYIKIILQSLLWIAIQMVCGKDNEGKILDELYRK